MAASFRQSQPTQITEGQGGVALPRSPALIAAKIDLLISLTLYTWPALTLAVTQHWGGPPPLSTEKRDWFAGAISDLLQNTPEKDLDEDYVEEFLAGVMEEEFECRVEDGSLGAVSEGILRLRRAALRGEFRDIDRLYDQWRQRQASGGGKIVARAVEAEGGDEDDEDDGEGEDEDEDEDGSEEEWNGIQDEEGDVDMDMDMDMDEAPALVVKAPREKVQPEVDKEGFTKVVGRKKR